MTTACGSGPVKRGPPQLGKDQSKRRGVEKLEPVHATYRILVADSAVDHRLNLGDLALIVCKDVA